MSISDFTPFSAPSAGPLKGRSRSSERRLLLTCLSRGTDPARIRALVRSDADWERIVSDATHHGVAPLMYSALRTVSDEATVPPAVSQRLAGLYYQQAALNGQFHAELRRVLVACAEAGRAVLVLKGAALAEPVYGNIALRPMTDLDLLVRREDLDATDRVLRALGYAPDESYRSAAWYREHHHHLAPYARPIGRAVIELHHHILPPTAPVRLPIEDLWRRARPAVVGSVPTLVLSPADLLLHLCLDISCVDHFVGKLRTLCDVAATIERHGHDINWPRLLEAARAYQAERFLYYPLWLARDLLKAAIPTTILRDLESSVPRPSLGDVSLRLMTRRAVLTHHHEAPAIPGWVMIRTCTDLLNARGTWGAIRALRPFDLLGRAVGRVVGQRQPGPPAIP